MFSLEPWFSRSFTFDFPVERLPIILDRLRGAPDRIEAKLRRLTPAALTRRPGTGWSIQEHVGHLHDLEKLHLRRLDDLAAGAATLSLADLENRATWAANHNARPFIAVLDDVRRSRLALFSRLESWDPARLADHATHPRLQQPMRVVDLAFFVAEHDDYHLARMQLLMPAPAAPLRNWTGADA
ncbi:MAG: DinB family protein [Phycisphaerae bacterium]|nr:DinB family protein [Phycisphaerae bacterium]